MEFTKALDNISNTFHTPCVAYETYASDAYVTASVETAYSIGAAGSVYMPSHFGIALDCEVYSNCNKEQTFAGINTQGSDIYLQSTHTVASSALGGRTSVQFCSYALFDAVLVFSPDGVVTIRT